MLLPNCAAGESFRKLRKNFCNRRTVNRSFRRILEADTFRHLGETADVHPLLCASSARYSTSREHVHGCEMLPQLDPSAHLLLSGRQRNLLNNRAVRYNAASLGGIVLSRAYYYNDCFPREESRVAFERNGQPYIKLNAWLERKQMCQTNDSLTVKLPKR